MQVKETKCVKSKSKKDCDIHNDYYQTMMEKKKAVEAAFSLYLDSVKEWVKNDEESKRQVARSEPEASKEWFTAKEWARQLGIKQNLLNSRLCVIKRHIPKEMLLFNNYRTKIPLYKTRELSAWVEKNYPGVLKPCYERGA